MKSKAMPMKKAPASSLSDDESRSGFAGAKLENERTGRTTTPREESVVHAAADKGKGEYRQAEDLRKDEDATRGGDFKKDQTVSGELKLADPAKSGKAEHAAPPTDRPASPQAQDGQRAPETRDVKEAPATKNGNLGGAGPAPDRRASGAPAGNAAPPAAEPAKAPQRLNSEVQSAPRSSPAPERDNPKPSAVANQTAKQVEQKAAPAKPSPPSQSAELHQQARKQASSGACAEALTLRDKISRIDPGYFNKNVAGDPAFRGCMDQQRAKAKRAAPAEASPRNDNLDAAEKNDTKAAH